MRRAVALAGLVLSVVAALPASVWREVPPMPLPPSGRPVGTGGWLVAVTVGDSQFVYAAKGNRTGDFYRYSVADSLWQCRRPLPFGPESTGFGSGARGAFDGSRHIYATKGDGTFDFWRYDIDADSWGPLPDVPIGHIRQPVTGGSDLCFHRELDTGQVYLLRSRSGEFHRFNVCSGEWQHLPGGPAGADPLWRDGSFIVCDGRNSIYAHKALRHEHYPFLVAERQWRALLPGMPFVGRRGVTVAAGAGSSAAWHENGYVALKGNGSNEFWRYDSVLGLWFELDEMPTAGRSGEETWVGAGAHIVRIADGTFLALKGNSTVEMWMYSEIPGVKEQRPVPAVRPGEPTIVRGSLVLSREPSSPGLRPPSPSDGEGRGEVADSRQPVVLLDAAGRRVMELGPGANDVRHLSPGVYFVREHPVVSSQHTASGVRKVVVTK